MELPLRPSQNYLQVLNRPLALSRDEDLIDWSLSYADAAVIDFLPTFSTRVELTILELEKKNKQNRVWDRC